MYVDFSDPDFLPIRIRAQEKRPIQTKEPGSETLIFSLTGQCSSSFFNAIS